MASILLRVLVPPALDTALRVEAARRGVTVAALVRLALAAVTGEPAAMPRHPGGPGRGHKGPVRR